ncbi:MAG: 1,6-anhydro-N-acetylmuramyl-L-alanine amidase AmpD [Thermoanaerobaculia bacterium]|nr:1,6-anhydro-N-acetylmuramyl-L-alanine amidase AmpD [Thermoanaerobaculia bacterium]
MRLDLLTGLVDGARQVTSPHQDGRPSWATIDLVVLHGISLPPGDFGGPFIEDLFLGRLDPTVHPFFAGISGLRVSAHFLIRRDGKLVQFVPVHRRAWHAGLSSYQGRGDVNSFSVGIELEGTDTVPYEDVQYDVLQALLAQLVSAYPGLAVTGHEHIAPGRKTDPGPVFDWQRIGVRP